jgi:hypothetical protein
MRFYYRLDLSNGEFCRPFPLQASCTCCSIVTTPNCKGGPVDLGINTSQDAARNPDNKSTGGILYLLRAKLQTDPLRQFENVTQFYHASDLEVSDGSKRS